MKNKLKVLLSLLAVCGVLGATTACNLGGGTSSEVESSVVESSEEVASSEEVGSSEAESSEAESSEEESSETESSEAESSEAESSEEESSEVESSEEESSEEESSEEVEAKYTVTFMADGVEVSVVEFTESNKEITVPEVPAKDGYTAAWESYELGADNVVVNAVYTAITYTISFNHPKTGMPLAAPIEFTVETKDSVVFPEAPADMAMEGYEVKWDKTEDDITLEDMQVAPVLVAIEYKVQFVDAEGMMIAAPIKYTVENMAEVVFPAVPAGVAAEGYTATWDKTEADLAIGGLTVSLTMTANTYKVTFDANGGEGMFIAANTWVQITITADDIVHGEGEGACAFLKLNGSTAGTYYIDNIQPLK